MLTFRQFFEASDMDSAEEVEKKKKKKDGKKKAKEDEEAEPGLDVNVAVSDEGRRKGSA